MTRNLAGAWDIASVVYARIRPRVDRLLPRPQGSWTSRVPQLADPRQRPYLAQITAMMDDRMQRLGQHTARTVPAWATGALGPLPADRASRHA